MARGNRCRSSATRASNASASGSRPSTTVTEVVTVATESLRADQPELPQAGRRLDIDRVVVGEAGVAETVLGLFVGPFDRGEQAVERQVTQRVGAHVCPNLLRRVVRRDQLLTGRRVDTVAARADGGRRADPHVDLPRAGAPDHPDDLARGGAAD